MELIFLGTGSGKTSLTRFHSSFLFKNGSNHILIDAGDGISKSLLTQNTSYNLISDIIITHNHSDHLAGLPSLLTQMIILKRTEDLRLHIHKELIERLNEVLNTFYLFAESYKFDLKIIGFEYNSIQKISDKIKFTAKKNSHIRNKLKIINSTLSFISSSFLFNINDKNIVYTSDIGCSDDLYLFNEIHHDIFITETTHISFEEIENAVTLLNPTKTYLTHIEDDTILNNWHRQLSIDKREKIIPAEDGMKLQI